MPPAATEPKSDRLDELLELRRTAGADFFAAEAERVARCCHRLAERFARGGRLLAVGAEGPARSDARHIAVEFVHPVIVGKRALPALAIAAEGGDAAAQLGLLAEPDDIVVALDQVPALGELRDRGCLTLAFSAVGAEWEFVPPGEDPCVRQELIETLYHVLWELVHVFFDHRGLLSAREARPVHDPGASSFLYPFLAESETDLDAVVEDVRRSVLIKAGEVRDLREQTIRDGREILLAAASVLRERFEAGGKLLAFGNGGSATDASDFVADLRSPPRSGWARRRAIDLTEDPGVLTAIANDVGVEEVFQRQVIAHGAAGDAAIAFSTSGSSPNLIAALAEARRRGLATIAMVGYDGGRIADEGLADHLVVSRSQHIPRIQEAQASAYHVLRELVEIV